MSNMPEASLHSILNIWPILSGLAETTPAGDFISLSRIDTQARAELHGFRADTNEYLERAADDDGVRKSLRIGHHETKQWALLKSLAPYECSSAFHTKGGNVHPCKYCSILICEACIVRSSFASRHENTFKNRVRYLCSVCWESGNLRKDYRHPTSHVSREQFWKGRSYSQRGNFCTCTLKYDGWLCIACKHSQNSLAGVNGVPHRDRSLLKGKGKVKEAVPCYGLGCTNYINGADDFDKERRRICLWCSKQLPRQFGGEERYRWDSKVIEARAINAASRSADIDEWARNRFRSLTMSRSEMRGINTCLMLWGDEKSEEHDRPQFVKHLDAINYRSRMPERCTPDPETVWKSKNGVWKYKPEFLKEIGERLSPVSTTTLVFLGIDLQKIRTLTNQGSLTFSRTNAEISREKRLASGQSTENIQEDLQLIELRARMLDHCSDLGVVLEESAKSTAEQDGFVDLTACLRSTYGVVTNPMKLQQFLFAWFTKNVKQPPNTLLLHGSDVCPPKASVSTRPGLDTNSESAVTGDNTKIMDVHGLENMVNSESLHAGSTLEEVDEIDSAVLEYVIQESLGANSSHTGINGIDPSLENPPPYSP